MTLEERFSVQLSENNKTKHTKLYAFVEGIYEGSKGFLLIDLTKEDFENYEIDVKEDKYKCIVPIIKLRVNETD